MLKPLPLILSEANAQPYQKVWVKYFKRHFSVGKDFPQSLPSLMKFAPIFEFKEFDSSILKKKILATKQMTQSTLDTILATELKIDKTPIPNNLDQLCDEAGKIQYNKSNEKNLNLVFDCIFRFFICYTYQFTNLLQKGQLNVKIMKSFIDYFILFQKRKRFVEDIYVIMKILLQPIESQWDSTFANHPPGSKPQFDLIYTIQYLVPMSKAFIQECYDSSFFKFIILQNNMILAHIHPDKCLPALISPIMNTFVDISKQAAIVNTTESSNLSSIAITILCQNKDFVLLNDTEKYEVGSKCIDIYSQCLQSLSDSTAMTHFDAIIEFCLWILFTFPDARKISSHYEEPMHKTELQPIGRTTYLEYAEILANVSPTVTNYHLKKSAEMLAKLITQSKYESMLISLLIQAMDKHCDKMETDQYQSFAAFVFFVIHKCKDDALFKGFSTNWNVLLSEAFFPEQNIADDRTLRDVVLTIFLRCFNSVPSSRAAILSAISEYLTQHSLEELRYFLPLLNKLLLSDETINFAQEFIKSPMMNMLLATSKDYLDIFDLLRHIMYFHPIRCFESRSILVFCFDNLMNPLYRESMIRCLENAMITCTKKADSQHVLASLICDISSSIQKFLKKDLEIANQLVSILANSMKSFDVSIFPTLFVANSFEILSQAISIIGTDDVFKLVIPVFTQLCSESEFILNHFLNKEVPIYAYLMQFIKKENHQIEINDYLFELAFLKQDDKSKSVIKNPFVIPLILENAKDKEYEIDCYSTLLKLCLISSKNVYAIVKTDVFTPILNRIRVLGLTDKTTPLFDLYSRIASLYLPNSAYYDTLTLMETTDEPEKFITLFISFLIQLKVPQHAQCNCNNFFHFEEPSNGIFGPSINLGTKFSIITKFRSEKIEAKKLINLLRFTSTKNDCLQLFLDDSTLIVKRMTSTTNLPNNQTTNTVSSPNVNSLVIDLQNKNNDTKELQLNCWFSLTILVEPTQVTVILNGKRYLMQGQLLPFQNNMFSVTIGNGFIGDIGPTYFLNDITIEKVDLISDKNIILQYLPGNVKDGQILKVAPNTNVTFSGQSELSVTTILDVIQSEFAIMNLLPLFSRFSMNTKSKLDFEEGMSFLENIFRYISIAMNENGLYMSDKHFFPILAQFFDNFEPAYFSTHFFDLLLKCFESLPKNNKDLVISMIESIWTNYDLISKYSDEVQYEYFSTILPKAYSIHQEIFNSYPYFNFLYYIVIQFFAEGSQTYNALYDFILSVLPQRTELHSYTSALSIPAFGQEFDSNARILEAIESMINNKNKLLFKAIEKVEYFTPFVSIFKFSNLKIQIQAMKIISILANLKLESLDLTKAIYELIFIYVPSENPIEFLQYVKSLFLDSEGAIEKAEYFPLVVSLSSLLKETAEAKAIFQEVMNSVKQYQMEAVKLTSEVHNWQFWMLKYLTTFISDSNSDDFISPIAILIETQIMSFQLNYKETFIRITALAPQFSLNSRDLLQQIMMHIFDTSDALIEYAGSELFKEAFILIFFNQSDYVKPTKSKVNLQTADSIKNALKEHENLNRLCWFPDNITSNYQFNLVTNDINGEIVWADQQFAEKILTKLSILSKYKLDFFDEQYDSVIWLTYIIINLIRFKSPVVASIVNEQLINELSTNQEQETAHICASLILRIKETIQNENEYEDYFSQFNLDQLEALTTTFKDVYDSYALQLFFFENSLFERASKLNSESNKVIQNYRSEVHRFTYSVLSIPINETNHQSNHLYSPSYLFLKACYDDLFTQQKNYLNGIRYFQYQVSTHFLRVLNVLADDDSTMNPVNYKAFNNITRKGRRVLMSIDYNDSIDLIQPDDLEHHIDETNSLNSGLNAYNTLLNASLSEGDPSLSPRQNMNTKQTNAKRDITVFRTIASLLTPHRLYKGELRITPNKLSFVGSDSKRSKRIELELNNIIFIMKRTYGRSRKASEVFTNANKSHYFIFSNHKSSKAHLGSIRHTFNEIIAQKCPISKRTSVKFDFFTEMRKVYNSIYQKKSKSSLLEIVEKLGIVTKWQKRELSNYEYLYYLNLLAGRSFNDLSKYPIYPLVLNLNNTEINLDDSTCYRCMQLPIGCRTDEEAQSLMAKFEAVKDPQYKFLFDSMFSNPVIVAKLLQNVEPFNTIVKELDSKQQIDFFELTPEYFTFQDVFGQLTTFSYQKEDEQIKTEKSSEIQPNPLFNPKFTITDEFINLNLRALENDQTSIQLHKWIDLIFGPQRCSLSSKNIYKPDLYPETIVSKNEEETLNQGHYPIQLFKSNHPGRNLNSNHLLDIKSELSAPAIRIRKNCVITTDMQIIKFNYFLNNNEYEVQTTRFVIPIPQTSFLGDIIEISRVLNLLVYATIGEPLITLCEFSKTNPEASIKKHKSSGAIEQFDNPIIPNKNISVFCNNNISKTIKFEHSSVQCSCISGGLILVVGLSDGNICIFDLPSCNLIRTSGFHKRPVVSVAANRELGLLVSINQKNQIIFELLNEQKFIRSLNLEKIVLEISSKFLNMSFVINSKPSILIYKSGVVCIILNVYEENTSFVFFFTASGEKKGVIQMNGIVKEFDKYYDFDQNEFLVLSIEPRKIMVIDVCKTEIFSSVTGSFGQLKFCTVKNCKAIMYSNGRITQTLPFPFA